MFQTNHLFSFYSPHFGKQWEELPHTVSLDAEIYLWISTFRSVFPLSGIYSTYISINILALSQTVCDSSSHFFQDCTFLRRTCYTFRCAETFSKNSPHGKSQTRPSSVAVSVAGDTLIRPQKSNFIILPQTIVNFPPRPHGFMLLFPSLAPPVLASPPSTSRHSYIFPAVCWGQEAEEWTSSVHWWSSFFLCLSAQQLT